MILNGLNSDDYVYLRLTENTKIPYGFIEFPKGTIVRFSIDFLRQRLWKWQVREEFFEREIDSKTYEKTDKYYYLDTSLNENIPSTELVPTKQYKSVRAKRDFDIVLPVQYGDLLVMNDWLKNKLSEDVPFVRSKMQFMDYRNVGHFNEDFFKNGNMISSPYISKETPMGIDFEIFQYQTSDELTAYDSDDGRIICKSGDAVCLQFKEGEEIDFSNPAVSLLFLDQEYVKFLLKTEVLSEEEKIEQFIKDFSEWLSEAGRKYYRIYDWIKIKTLRDITDHEIFETIRKRIPDFENVFYNNYNYSQYDDFDFDENGYLRYVWTSGGIDRSVFEEVPRLVFPR